MSFIKETEKYIKEVIAKKGYDIDKVVLESSSRRDLGEFQINVCMSLAKKYGKKPRELATEIVDSFDDRFENVNIAGPGFINLNLKNEILLNSINESINNFDNFVDKENKKKIIIDYGGANAAKMLHVGHMRTANIGEALRRLAVLFGNDVIGDVHLGDLGRQSGMVISEIKKRFPDLPYFDKNYKGEYPEYKITNEQLGEYYPIASKEANENPNRLEEVRNICAEVDKGNEPYFTLWKDITKTSVVEIKKTYDYLNCKFDLWEGEMSSFKYLKDTLEVLKPFMYESQGAQVIDVKKDTDKIEVPPLIIIKNDGATIYATRDLATIYGRMKEYSPDEIWYCVDQRQSLYLEQVFRVSHISKLVKDETLLVHYSNGTMNAKDGKPFKTRDGGVLPLNSLIEQVKNELKTRMTNEKAIEDSNNISDILTVATIKYADLLPYRTTDYIFDIDKICSFEGKTGPYILYSLVRIKSIFSKLNIDSNCISNIYGEDDKNIYLKIIELSRVLTNSYKEKVTSHICEYLFELCSLFNKFYSEHNIINEKDEEKQKSYIALLHLVYNVADQLLSVLAIKIPDKM